MSSTNTTYERINNFTIAINAIIESNVDIETINDSDANFIRNMLIRFRTDIAFLNALTNFNIIIFFYIQIISYKFYLFEYFFDCKYLIIIRYYLLP